MGNNSFRLSRISHPRATLWAMVLLALVFLFFGLAAQAYVPAIEWSSGNSADFRAWQSASAYFSDLIPYCCGVIGT